MPLELLGRGDVVEAIGAEFGITQAAVSQHLKVLRESGFARVRADAVARRSGWEDSDNQDGHFGGRGGRMIVAARR
jgi:DNA-binding transcriptional ArsR family regulator